MKLSQLFSIFSHLKWGDQAYAEVANVTSDSRKVIPGTVFVAVKGMRHDGHQYLRQVCGQGAIGLVVESETHVPHDFRGAVVKVANSRQALSGLAAQFYDNPADKLFCVGLTGTNGKTTTTHMIEAILTAYGWPTGVMGTIDHHLGSHVWSSTHTTADPVVFQERLADFVEFGAKAMTVEVSSHALKQDRVEGVHFDIVGFTNLTRDHLDYHLTMQDYFESKQLLFTKIIDQSTKKHRFAVLNHDDEYGKQLQVADGVKTWTYGASASCDFVFSVLKQGFEGTEIKLDTPRGRTQLWIPLPGLMNVYNAVCATAIAMAAGVSLEGCATGLKNLEGVKGRMQRVSHSKNIHVFIDYAHTPDALENVLKTLQSIRLGQRSSSRIITVFGCGGDRDQGKRPIMGQVAVENSDFTFVTSDNPRTEKPMDILLGIEAGIMATGLTTKHKLVVERKRAIVEAVQMAQPEDVVLIAGKGHEEYQEIAGVQHPFSDLQVALEALQ